MAIEQVAKRRPIEIVRVTQGQRARRPGSAVAPAISNLARPEFASPLAGELPAAKQRAR